MLTFEETFDLLPTTGWFLLNLDTFANRLEIVLRRP
jgi:hypothetical protein